METPTPPTTVIGRRPSGFAVRAVTRAVVSCAEPLTVERYHSALYALNALRARPPYVISGTPEALDGFKREWATECARFHLTGLTFEHWTRQPAGADPWEVSGFVDSVPLEVPE